MSLLKKRKFYDFDNIINNMDIHDFVNILKNKNHKLYKNLTESINDESWINKNSVSIYFFDDTGKVLLYRSNERRY